MEGPAAAAGDDDASFLTLLVGERRGVGVR